MRGGGRLTVRAKLETEVTSRPAQALSLSADVDP